MRRPVPFHVLFLCSCVFVVCVAIGHSTNLIGRESNIIIIRGRGDQGRSIYAQMLHAVEEYFPRSGLLDDPLVITDELEGGTSSRRNSQQMYPLQRVNTGVSSIVGSDNGHKPGGFVLVIDGLALTDVRALSIHYHLPTLIMNLRICRRWATTSISICCSILRCSARPSCAAACRRNKRLSLSTLSKTAWAR